MQHGQHCIDKATQRAACGDPVGHEAVASVRNYAVNAHALVTRVAADPVANRAFRFATAPVRVVR